MKMKTFSVLIILLIAFGSCLKAEANDSGSEPIQIPVSVVKDKIRGGLLGQMLGNLNGIPHEMKYIDEPGNVLNYTPSLPEGARTDDDTDFEWVYICEIQKRRNAFLTSDEIAELWRTRINRKIWCSNRYARYLMDIGMKPPRTGYAILNPWAEFNISGQFLCETFGLLAPAMPQTAAKVGINYTSVAIGGEPAQTTALFTTMIAQAFIEEDVSNLIEAGLSAVDPSSKLRNVISDVQQWHQSNPDNWRVTRQLLADKYTQEQGKMRDMNGFELNTGAIIAALLYGDGNFAESLKLAFNFGWDADCNAATVGTILGVIQGYNRMMSHNDPLDPDWIIVDRYRNTTRDNMPNHETITSFADRIIEIFEMLNEQKGGQTKWDDHEMVYVVVSEQPESVIDLFSLDQQEVALRDELEDSILENILNGNREEKALSAYMAVSIGLNPQIAKAHPKEWEDACYQLSGYWKIMNNLLNEDSFQGIRELQSKFIAAGFKVPARRYLDKEIYYDQEIWKDPADIY